MLLWSIKISIISLLFIVLIHNIITFLKSTLTVPKIKDLVNTSPIKYQKMFDTLNNKNPIEEINTSCTSIDQLPLMGNEPSNNFSDINMNINMNDNQNIVSSSMKNELKNFLKSQMNDDNTTSIFN